MKSIFKKIAFVLALAMVVTMLPAKTAGAASSDGPQMYSTLRLYLGGDVTGTYADANYAKVWNKDGYTVAFESDAEEVATVNAKGYVRAVSVGTANITAAFTAADGTTVTKTCVVTVKKNASAAGIGAKNKATLEEGITVGTEMQLVAVRKDENGTVARTGKVDLTDGMRFQSSDESVFTVGATKGMLVAVGPGEATLTVWAVQSEGADPDTEDPFTKYPATTEKKEYTVVVKSAMSAEQSAHNAFQITFDTEATAKAAVDETSKYFTSASAAVTEKEDIVKVYKVLKNASNEKIGETAVIIGNLSQKSDAKNVVNVTMFDELDQQTDYIIRYMDQEVTVATTKNVAAKLSVAGGSSETLGEDTSKTNVVLRIFAVGANGQDVDITNCRDYLGWTASVTLEEISDTLYHVEYNFVTDPLNPVIYFYTKDAKIAVNVKATFKDYFNEEKKGNELVDTTTIYPGNHSLVSGQIMAWGVANESAVHTDWDAFISKEFAADDLGKKLIIDADVYYGDEKIDVTSCCDSKFSFKTENEDKLIVDEDNGYLFPPKEPKDGIVNVYVYYDDMYIGVCPVKVWAKREFTNFTASVDSQKLSYNPNGDIDDVITLTMSPVDQLGSAFTKDMSVIFEVYGNSTVKDYIGFYGAYSEEGNWYTVSDPDLIWDGTYQVKIKAKNLPVNQVCSLRILCTATYNDGITKKTLTSSVAFAAKDTSDPKNQVKNYQLVTTNDIELKLTGGEYDGGRINDKTALIKAYSLDKDGFKIEHLPLVAKSGAIDTSATNSDAGKNTVIVNQLNDYVGGVNLVQAGRDLKFVPVTTANVAVVTGSAIDGWASNVRSGVITGSAVEARTLVQKIKTGSYQVSLFISEGSSKPAYKAGTVIRVEDSQPIIQWSWDNHSVSENAADVAGVIEAIKEAFNFKKLDDNNVQSYIIDNIYVGYIQTDRAGNPIVNEDGEYTVVLSDDFVVQGDQVSVKQVRCIVKYIEQPSKEVYYYEMIVPINKSIRIGVSQ